MIVFYGKQGLMLRTALKEMFFSFIGFLFSCDVHIRSKGITQLIAYAKVLATDMRDYGM